MAKVTYHEYRPGHWVKIVDGEAVGPATAEEVARWQEEKAEQAKIWQDVVRGTAPASPPERPAEEGAPKGRAARVDEAGIWQDVVSQTVEPPKASTGPRADRKTEPSPPQTVEEAVRSARRGRPVSVKGGKVVAPDEGQRPGTSRVTPTPATEAAVTQAAPVQPAEKLAEPTRKRMTSERKKPRPEPVPKPAVHPDRKPKPKGEDIDTLTKPVVRKGEAPPTKIRRRRRKEAEVGGGAASVEAASPAEGARAAKPEPKRRRAKTTRPGKAVQAKAAPVMEVPQVDEPRSARAALAEGQPAAEPLPTPEAPSIEEAAVESPQSKRAAQVIPAPRSTMSRPPSAPQRRRKPSASTPQARLQPAYLWVMADAGDNVAAAVRTGLARYEERFGKPAGVVLCHLNDLPIVEAADLPVETREGKSVLPRNFWIGPK